MAVFSDPKVTSSEIGGAVAEAILYDIRMNSLGLNGFPEVSISRQNEEGFKVYLQFGGHSQNFEMSNFEAKNAVQRMKSQKGYDPNIFDRIQEALAKLEGTVTNSR